MPAGRIRLEWRLPIEFELAGDHRLAPAMSEEASAVQQRPNALVRAVPILGWLPHYEKAWLTFDLLAGLSVWALVVPQALGYAAVVGVPAQYGLYTILGASVLYAVFASTRQVVTGPSASVAAVTAPVAAFYVASTSPNYLSTVIALTLWVGVVYVLLGVFRMGWVSNFLAKAVLEGFIFAVGLGLIVDQLPSILGIPKAKGSYWDVLVGVVKDLDLTNLATLAVGALAVGLLLVMRFTAPRLPRAFIVVILGIVVVPLFDLKAHGVVVVGMVPSGLPSLGLPTGFSVSEWLELAVGALAIILVSYSESIATATDSAARHKQEFSPDQELVAQGAAWVGSSLVGGFPGCGSLSKTAVSEGAGQKTQLAGLTVAGLTVVTLLFLAGLFSNLPKAVLGAVVVDAALGLVHFKVATRIAAASSRIFGVFVATAIGLFFVGVVAGIIFGLVLSLLLLVQRSAKSPLRRMGFDSVDQVYVEADTHPDATTPDGVLVVKVDGPLFFADAATFRTDLLNLVAAAEVTVVVVDFEATSHIDLDGADMLTKVNGELADTGVRLMLTHTNASELDMLQRAGTLNAVGEANVFETARAAVAAATEGSPESRAPLSGATT
jgi:sulfate permease, SulP family